MSQFSEEISISASPDHIFALYQDVVNWKRWGPDVASSSISGPFTAGAAGKLKPRKGPEAKIEIISVEKNKSFPVRSKLTLLESLAAADVIRTVTVTPTFTVVLVLGLIVLVGHF